MRITVRPAQMTDLAVIEHMVRHSPHTPFFEGMDMVGAENYWLLAEKGDDVLGCILIAFGKPYAFMDFLCMVEDLSDVDRGRVVSRLTTEADAILASSGASFIVSAIPHELRTYRRVAKRRGYRTAASGALVYKRVA